MKEIMEKVLNKTGASIPEVLEGKEMTKAFYHLVLGRLEKR